MDLDPSESINNMGKLRVDVLDASDLPSADRNGYSDPYCKFELNGNSVFKTKVQKKTLHPAWNEFFEVEIPSRTSANFICNVLDWDFGDKADHLGKTEINLNLLEPFKPKEMNLALDGKSGTIRLRLLFRPDYVTRSRQGSSTFSGTFATPGKIVTGVAGAPIKGVGFAAHGVGKGASFIKNSFRGGKKKDADEVNGTLAESEEDVPTTNGFGGPRRASGFTGVPPPIPEIRPPVTPPNESTPHHNRTKSFGATSAHSNYLGSPGGSGAPIGVANFTIVSAVGFPPSSSVMVYIKSLGPKPKVIHKTEHIKSPSGTVVFNEKKESFKCTAAADATFQVSVKAHNTFGSDDDLGEGALVIDETGTMQEKQIRCGAGYIIVKSNFVMNSTESGQESPKSGFRRSLLSKKEIGGRTSRDITPVGTQGSSSEGR
jgi:hypothetical protein